MEDGLYTKDELLAAVKHAEAVGHEMIEEDEDNYIHAIVIEQLFDRLPTFFDEMKVDQLLPLQGLVTHVMGERIRRPHPRTPR